MIQIIGLMIAAYILFRAIEIPSRGAHGGAGGVVIFFAVIAAFAAVLGAIGLLFSGVNTPSVR